MPTVSFKIFIIEDDPADISHLKQLLGKAEGVSFEMTVEKSLVSGLSQFEIVRPDAVLVDLTLPDGRGVMAVTRLHEKFPGTPIVALNIVDNEALALQAIQEGAQDYIVKDRTDSETLKRAVLFSIDRKKVERELARLASFAWQNPNAILECNFAGEILYLNPAGQALFPALKTEGARHPFLEKMEELAAGLQREKKEFLIREIELDDRVFEQHISLVIERQVIRSYIADITERKAAEEALRVRTQEVERMNRVMVGREIKMAELKKKISELQEELGRAA